MSKHGKGGNNRWFFFSRPICLFSRIQTQQLPTGFPKPPHKRYLDGKCCAHFTLSPYSSKSYQIRQLGVKPDTKLCSFGLSLPFIPSLMVTKTMPFTDTLHFRIVPTHWESIWFTDKVLRQEFLSVSAKVSRSLGVCLRQTRQVFRSLVLFCALKMTALFQHFQFTPSYW